MKALKERFDIPVLIDRYKPAVAEATLKNGEDIINDIWGLQRDPEMVVLVGKYNAPIIVMHNQDTYRAAKVTDAILKGKIDG